MIFLAMRAAGEAHAGYLMRMMARVEGIATPHPPGATYLALTTVQHGDGAHGRIC